MTEAQFAKMVSIYFDLKETEEKLDKFTNKQTWNDVHYNSLAAHVVPLNGYFDDNIRNSVVKRGTVAQVLAYIGGYKMGLNDSIDFLLDNKITVDQDQSYKDKELLKYFGSNNKLTRAQVVTFLYRMNHNNLSEINSNTIISFDNDDRLDKKASEGKNRVDQSLAVGENKIIEDNRWSVESDEGSASWNGSGRPGVSDGGYGNHLDREIEDLDKDNKYSAEIKKVLPNDYVFGAMGDDIMFIERKGMPALSISLVDDYEYSDYIAKGNINLDIYEKSNENIEVAYELSKLFGLKLNKDRFTKNLKKSENVDDTFVKEEKYRFINMAGGSYFSVYWDK